MREDGEEVRHVLHDGKRELTVHQPESEPESKEGVLTTSYK